MNIIFPTPYPDVNEILDHLLISVKEILGDQFVGMYLFGSLANGDFDIHSDIDVLIATKDEITEAAFLVLYTMHEKISRIDSPWAFQLEVSYIPLDSLRRYNPSRSKHPHLDRDESEKLHIMQHASDWIIQRYILRERGVTVEGPDPQTLIDPISSNDLRQAIADVLPLWVSPILDDPSRINKRGYQSFFVLSLCRVLYTLKHGEIASKPVAAKWGKENLDARWTPLIESAILGRQNPGLDAQPEDINGTLDMMRYTLNVILSDPLRGERRISNMASETLHRSGSHRPDALRESDVPTPYPEVNEVLSLLLSDVKEILGDQFVGMYLYGSLSSGDFDPETSDIDFLFVTKNALSDETITKLEAMHKQTWATSLKRAGKLEGAYVPKALIRRHNPNGAPCPTVNEGRFYVAGLGSDWIIQRHVVRGHGVVVEGPDPKTLIDFVTPDDIRESVMGVLREWWFPMLDDPSWLRDHESGYRSFAVITMCRVLHALENRTIVSKPKAVEWARTKLDGLWKQLIDKAVAVSNHEDLDVPLGETLDFIQLIREKVK